MPHLHREVFCYGTSFFMHNKINLQFLKGITIIRKTDGKIGLPAIRHRKCARKIQRTKCCTADAYKPIPLYRFNFDNTCTMI